LVRGYKLDVSPATVRNELAALEDAGLLTHPHTSAGRVPTDLGYRYFIETLMPSPSLRPDEQVTVSHQFQQALQDTAAWLRVAAATKVHAAAGAEQGAEADITRALARILDEYDTSLAHEVYVDGFQNILAKPEFAEGDRSRAMLSLFEDHTRLSEILPLDLGDGEVHITIGREHRHESLRDCSLVIGRYGASRDVVGFVGA